MNFDNKDSFFYRILKVLELYELPDIASLITIITDENYMERLSLEIRYGVLEGIIGA